MLTERQIQFLNRAFQNRWTEENGIINVEENVDISSMYLTEIPVQFGKVSGYFECIDNQLTSLKGGPSIIEGDFDCDTNQLTSLEGGPKELDGYYSCSNNQLINLLGAPEICNDTFWCHSNQLTSLEGCPKLIKGNLYCANNSNLHILYGIGRVSGTVEYGNCNDLNEWIIEHARANIFMSYTDIAEWIKQNNKLEFLLHSQKEIREYFSPRILHLVDSGMYNESRILDYKKFSRLC